MRSPPPPEPITPSLPETIHRVVIQPHPLDQAWPQLQRNRNLDEGRRFVTLDMEPVLAWVNPVAGLTYEEWVEYAQGEHDAAQSEPGAHRLIHTPGTPEPEPLQLTFHDVPYAYSYLHAPSYFRAWTGLV